MKVYHFIAKDCTVFGICVEYGIVFSDGEDVIGDIRALIDDNAKKYEIDFYEVDRKIIEGIKRL